MRYKDETRKDYRRLAAEVARKAGEDPDGSERSQQGTGGNQRPYPLY